MKKAQAILEYSVLIACFIAALVVMQIYVKRGIQGRLKAVAADLGKQYAPKNTESDLTLTIDSKTTTEVKTVEKENPAKPGEKYNEVTTTTNIDHETQSQEGYETVGEPESTLF